MFACVQGMVAAIFYVCDEELFERSILNQPVCDNKFITLENRKRNSNIVLEFIKQELTLRLKIYEQCNCTQETRAQNLQVLVGHL